jgi:hypothetical protein
VIVDTADPTVIGGFTKDGVGVGVGVGVGSGTGGANSPTLRPMLPLLLVFNNLKLPDDPLLKSCIGMFITIL